MIHFTSYYRGGTTKKSRTQKPQNVVFYSRNEFSSPQKHLSSEAYYYRLGKYSYARETDRSSSRALPPMNARLGMLEAIIMTVIPKQSQLKMVRFKILTEDHLYE